MLKNKTIPVLFIFASIFAFPSVGSANHNSDREGDSDWEGNEAEEIRGWRRYNSEIRDAIDALPDTRVDNLSIPVVGVTPRELTRNFGDSRGGGTRTHEGLDIMASKGTPIVSPTESVVIRTGEGSNSGIHIYAAAPGGETFVYMHLNAIAEGIEAGTKLTAGQVIGYVGNTGNASGGPAHLHFEIKVNGEAQDPYPRLTQTSVATKVGDTTIDTNVFSRHLTIGARGEDVRTLQKFLNHNGYFVAASGAGSLGNETTYFGALTEKALAKFQSDHNIRPSVGYFGSITMAYIRGA